MTNREAYDKFTKSAEASLSRIDNMKNLVSKNSQLYKKEHNNAANCVLNALSIMAKTHSLNEKFFKSIQHIIDRYPESKEYWDWLKMTSMGHM